MPSLRELQDERNRAWERMKEIHEQAKKEGRDLNTEETANWDKASADVDRLGAIIEREHKIGTLGDFLSQSAKPNVAAAIRGTSDDKLADTYRSGHESRVWEPTKRRSYNFDRSGEVTEEQKKLFREWVQFGTMNGREVRALQSDSDTAGGFTVPIQQFQNGVIQQVHDNVFIFDRATNYTVERAESLGAPVLQTQLALPTWGTELSGGSADTALTFGKRELRPHPLAGFILVSKKLLRQSGIDVEALVRDQIAYKIGVAVEQALLNGQGAGKPLGIFSTDVSSPISTSQDTVSSSSNTFASTEGTTLIQAKYGLKQQYWGNSVWVMNRQYASAVRQMQDVNGQFLWQPGGGFSASLAAGNEPAFDTIAGRPVLMSEYSPLSTGTGGSPTSNQSPAVTGNSSTLPHTGYIAALADLSRIWTATALTMQIQRLVELKAESNQDEFIYRMEVDGMPVIGEAFSRIRLKGY